MSFRHDFPAALRFVEVNAKWQKLWWTAIEFDVVDTPPHCETSFIEMSYKYLSKLHAWLLGKIVIIICVLQQQAVEY